MLLSLPEVELVFRLHRTLMFFVNQRFPVVPNEVATPEELAAWPPELRVKVRDVFLEHTDLIESFVAENPFHLPADELAIIHSWRHLVAGKFYIFRELQKYTVFLSADQQPVAYGVLALSQPFEELIGPYLPVLTQTVLLPFKDRIVYDGLMQSYRISFGAGIRRSLNESYKEAKERHGIVTSLPVPATTMAARAPKPKVRPRPKAPTKEETAEVLNVILGMIEPFCREHLNEEYAVLCRKMAEKLARKRPSPLLSGSPNTWASGIVRTVGWVNFLSDKTQTPHMRLSDIDAFFGISESTGAAKLKAIRTMLKIHRFEPEWTLPSKVEDNPLIWILEVNGLMMDVRQAPREVQEIAFQKGLIPYIPADRPPRSE
jgi:hypothetical protein